MIRESNVRPITPERLAEELRPWLEALMLQRPGELHELVAELARVSRETRDREADG